MPLTEFLYYLLPTRFWKWYWKKRNICPACGEKGAWTAQVHKSDCPIARYGNNAFKGLSPEDIAYKYPEVIEWLENH